MTKAGLADFAPAALTVLAGHCSGGCAGAVACARCR